VIPVVDALGPHVRVSIDTRKPAVAEGAISAGATLVNDISASLDDVVAAAGPGVGWVAMHMQGEPATMQHQPRYVDVVEEVHSHLVERAERATARGIEEVWIDPGIGFGKSATHNLALLRHIDRFVGTGFPVLVATSRKAFVGRIHAASDQGRRPPADDTEPAPVDDRLEGSVATGVWALLHGVGMIRVHDVRATIHAAKVVAGRIEG
ncbi:MAG: dihydropteroate synthase, partial [Acidimicrobiales bacterium]